MKPTAISADVLFEDHRAALKWEWVAGLGASERRFDEIAVRAARSGADLVGYLNYIHPYRVQILGEREVAYLTSASAEDCIRRVSRIIKLEPSATISTGGSSLMMRETRRMQSSALALVRYATSRSPRICTR